MKKFILSATFLAVLSLSAAAQQNITAGVTTIKKTVTVREAPKRLVGPVANIGIGFGPAVCPEMTDYEISYTGLNAKAGFGYQITPQFYAGGAVGVTLLNANNSISIPLVGEVCWFLSDHAKSSWFIDAEAGYNFKSSGITVTYDRNMLETNSKDGLYFDYGPIVGIGTGWSGNKVSIKIEVQYNSAYALDKKEKIFDGTSLLYTGFHLNYHFKFGRKY